jgi:hypothetical protein
VESLPFFQELIETQKLEMKNWRLVKRGEDQMLEITPAYLRERNPYLVGTELVPLPAEMHPFPDEEHKLRIDPQISPGKYTLVTGMRHVTTKSSLSAYDEVAHTWLPENQIVLGEFTIP